MRHILHNVISNSLKNGRHFFVLYCICNIGILKISENQNFLYQTAISIYDGHRNHISIIIITKAIPHKIKLICFTQLSYRLNITSQWSFEIYQNKICTQFCSIWNMNRLTDQRKILFSIRKNTSAIVFF